MLYNVEEILTLPLPHPSTNDNLHGETVQVIHNVEEILTNNKMDRPSVLVLMLMNIGTIDNAV